MAKRDRSEMDRVGAALCNARIDVGMEQYELAAYLGISTSMMSYIESGQRHLKLTLMLKLPAAIRERLLKELENAEGRDTGQ